MNSFSAFDVEALEHAGKPLAEMADDLQPRKAVEYAAEDEADDVDRGFDVPGSRDLRISHLPLAKTR